MTIKKNLPQGFTLIELMTVIAIVGLLTGSGYLSYRTFQQKEELKASVRETVSDIRYAQSAAISGIKPTSCSGEFESVEIDFNSNGYDINGNCSISGVSQYKSVVFSSNIVFVEPATDPIIFETPQGKTNLLSDVSVSISHALLSGSNKIITVSINGNVSE